MGGAEPEKHCRRSRARRRSHHADTLRIGGALAVINAQGHCPLKGDPRLIGPIGESGKLRNSIAKNLIERFAGARLIQWTSLLLADTMKPQSEWICGSL